MTDLLPEIPTSKEAIAAFSAAAGAFAVKPSPANLEAAERAAKAGWLSIWNETPAAPARPSAETQHSASTFILTSVDLINDIEAKRNQIAPSQLPDRDKVLGQTEETKIQLQRRLEYARTLTKEGVDATSRLIRADGDRFQRRIEASSRAAG